MAQFSVAFLLIGTLRVATAAHGGHLPLKATDVDDVVTYAFGSDGLLEEYADAYGLCNIIATACHMPCNLFIAAASIRLCSLPVLYSRSRRRGEGGHVIWTGSM